VRKCFEIDRADASSVRLVRVCFARVDNIGAATKGVLGCKAEGLRLSFSDVEIRLNGERSTFADGLSLTELLAVLGLGERRVAVEVNRDIVPRESYAATRLCAGDVVEVVQFVGGG
jgi:thiamine biosynthesis protein ThiS